MVNLGKASTYRSDRCSIETRKVTSLTLALLLTLLTMAPTFASPSGSIPRRSPELTLNETSGKQIQLSSFHGKVVVIEFLFLRSLHCQRVAQTLNRLYSDLGPRGFQPVGIVFGPGADAQKVIYFAQDSKLTYPVGFSTPDVVDGFLARGPDETLNIPQVVVIDRAGMIRAQSGGKGGDLTLENENSLRILVNDLLNEEPPQTWKKAPSPAQRNKVNLSKVGRSNRYSPRSAPE